MLSKEDEARLDRHEGVPTAYEKHLLDIDLYFPRNRPRSQRGSSVRPVRSDGERVTVKALVYLSPQYTTDSAPREEYVNRMIRGLQDSLDFGMSEDYVSNVVMPALRRRPNQNRTAASAFSRRRANVDIERNRSQRFQFTGPWTQLPRALAESHDGTHKTLGPPLDARDLPSSWRRLLQPLLVIPQHSLCMHEMVHLFSSYFSCFASRILLDGLPELE
ncbi:hypothetical protein CPC735_042770 [Coccidioides posadasii C735 delta SOWgp]|uniref:Uncharacterized protein n=2 Tax=Coccidioides posadasii TaxID=199306 RepID=A0A0J6FKZ8_COCPO|nr:hypothetical protein CPC735_042770 [Coccidioides posadasii C735 delta SOWgp]EER25833.1 hypothetical protein CPC735_042770 [Coccidioides posadasii C735 delta SOWgp]KMM69524.1 hypothetical protein CPAG_05839 [Coccidioides posadasii RMSCC 3488]|eukprot:XP_003067978.1 hypothetical protein CPC735_042770 [Coccidioides posadasii C735 delta SOWgp]